MLDRRLFSAKCWEKMASTNQIRSGWTTSRLSFMTMNGFQLPIPLALPFMSNAQRINMAWVYGLIQNMFLNAFQCLLGEVSPFSLSFPWLLVSFE
jgi:hypothetical protein